MRQVRGVVAIVMVHEVSKDERRGPVQGTRTVRKEKNKKKIKTEGEEKGEGGGGGLKSNGRGEEVGSRTNFTIK
jgi:hypothetical protein